MMTEDLGVVRQLNNDAYPAVPTATAEELDELVGVVDWAVVVEKDAEVVGFLLAVEPGKNYDSENYRFFESRGLPHFYIDRIVLGEGSRGKGLGKRLYEEVFVEAGRRGYPRVTCEVNLKPENPASLAFHAALGFSDVGVQETKGGDVTVQLLEALVGGGDARD
jgi:predicted GNAT superfamily acetyltransferase